MALSLGAVSALTSRLLKKLHYAVTNQAGANSTVATGDVVITFDASDNYEGKYSTVTEAVTGALNGATIAEVNAAADVSARRVAVGDANYTVLAANSGKPHMVANVSADRTFTLPTPASGLDYEFIAEIAAADGHDWIIDTGSDTNYFVGGILHVDTDADAAGDEIVAVFPDGNSNSKLQINLPQGGTRVRFICDGTLWTVVGTAVSATAPTFADQ